MLPRVGRSKPPTICRNVLLPQPDGPTMLTNSPSATSIEKVSMAVTVRPARSNVLLRSRTTSAAAGAALSAVMRRTADSFRQIGQVDDLLYVDRLFQEPGLDLQFLHLLQRV